MLMSRLRFVPPLYIAKSSERHCGVYLCYSFGTTFSSVLYASLAQMLPLRSDCCGYLGRVEMTTSLLAIKVDFLSKIGFKCVTFAFSFNGSDGESVYDTIPQAEFLVHFFHLTSNSQDLSLHFAEASSDHLSPTRESK
jgi:hypothetical protein